MEVINVVQSLKFVEDKRLDERKGRVISWRRKAPRTKVWQESTHYNQETGTGRDRPKEGREVGRWETGCQEKESGRERGEMMTLCLLLWVFLWALPSSLLLSPCLSLAFFFHLCTFLPFGSFHISFLPLTPPPPSFLTLWRGDTSGAVV